MLESSSGQMAERPSGSTVTFSRPTMTQQLEREKEQLESRLGDINRALDALKAHPDVQMALDAIAKVIR